MASNGNDVIVVILKGKVERVVQQSHMCWSHHPSLLESPPDFEVGVNTFRFMWLAFWADGPAGLDREWHLA